MAKRIPLTQGQFAIVDDEDYEILKDYKWFAIKGRQEGHFYAVHTFKVPGGRANIGMHRCIMNYFEEGKMVDHEDRNGLNNRKNNLRICTLEQNNRNAKKRKDGVTSKFRGVHKHTTLKRTIWVAQICFNKKKIRLGNYMTEIEAAIAYNKGALKYFGEFASLNPIPNQC